MAGDGLQLGPRADALYTTDYGTTYRVKVFQAILAPAGFSAYDPGAPRPLKPRSLKMRYVNAESASGVSKKIPIGKPDFSAWTDTPTAITIDAVAYTTTSRGGESNRF